MSYYTNGYNVSTVIAVSSNDTNGSITGYYDFPLSNTAPSNYTYMKIPNSLGYKINGTDIAANQDLVNAYSNNYTNTTGSTSTNIADYNYMSGVLVGGGGGGGRGGGSNYTGGGGGGGGSAVFYRVNISNSDTITVTVGSGGDVNTDATTNGDSGGGTKIYISDSDYILANGGNGGAGGNVSGNRRAGGSRGNSYGYGIFAYNSTNGNGIVNSNNSSPNFNSSNGGNSGASNNDLGGNGGNVGYWKTALANATFGNGGEGGDSEADSPNGDGNSGNSGYKYGGGGGGGAGTNEDNNWRSGGPGYQGYVQIWLYKS